MKRTADWREIPWEIGNLVIVTTTCSSSRGDEQINYAPGDIGIITDFPSSVGDQPSNAVVYVKGREEEFYLGYLKRVEHITGVP